MDSEEHARWLEQVFSSQRFMRHLGVELVSWGPGRCELTLPGRPEFEQHSGVIHAGAVAALADNAAGGAATSLMPVGTAAITAEYKISLVAPAQGDRLVARAEVLSSGRTLVTCESKVFAVDPDGETLCAVALVTLVPWRLASE